MAFDDDERFNWLYSAIVGANSARTYEYDAEDLEKLKEAIHLVAEVGNKLYPEVKVFQRNLRRKELTNGQAAAIVNMALSNFLRDNAEMILSYGGKLDLTEGEKQLLSNAIDFRVENLIHNAKAGCDEIDALFWGLKIT